MSSAPPPWRVICRTAPNGLSWSETKTSKPSSIASIRVLPIHCADCVAPLAPVAGRQPPLDHLRIARHAETEDPEDEAGKDVAGHRGGWREPFGVGIVELHDAEQVEEADNEHKAGVLEQPDEGVDNAGDHELQGLRQDYEPHFLAIG